MLFCIGFIIGIFGFIFVTYNLSFVIFYLMLPHHNLFINSLQIFLRRAHPFHQFAVPHLKELDLLEQFIILQSESVHLLLGFSFVCEGPLLVLLVLVDSLLILYWGWFVTAILLVNIIQLLDVLLRGFFKFNDQLLDLLLILVHLLLPDNLLAADLLKLILIAFNHLPFIFKVGFKLLTFTFVFQLELVFIRF